MSGGQPRTGNRVSIVVYAVESATIHDQTVIVHLALASRSSQSQVAPGPYSEYLSKVPTYCRPRSHGRSETAPSSRMLLAVSGSPMGFLLGTTGVLRVHSPQSNFARTPPHRSYLMPTGESVLSRPITAGCATLIATLHVWSACGRVPQRQSCVSVEPRPGLRGRSPRRRWLDGPVASYPRVPTQPVCGQAIPKQRGSSVVPVFVSTPAAVDSVPFLILPT